MSVQMSSGTVHWQRKGIEKPETTETVESRAILHAKAFETRRVKMVGPFDFVMLFILFAAEGKARASKGDYSRAKGLRERLIFREFGYFVELDYPFSSSLEIYCNRLRARTPAAWHY